MSIPQILQQMPHSAPPLLLIRIVREGYHANVANLVSSQTRHAAAGTSPWRRLGNSAAPDAAALAQPTAPTPRLQSNARICPKLPLPIARQLAGQAAARGSAAFIRLSG